jgi:hypothetical protein
MKTQAFPFLIPPAPARGGSEAEGSRDLQFLFLATTEQALGTVRISTKGHDLLIAFPKLK